MTNIIAGVDRIKLYNFELDEFYKPNNNEKYSIVRIEDGDVFRIAKDSKGIKFKLNYIKATNKQGYDGGFTELKVGSSKGKDKAVENYQHLDINPSRILSIDGINLKNVSTKNEFDKVLYLMEDEIKKNVCKKVDFSQAKIKILETNVNIPLDNEFCEYEQAFEYCRSLLPMRMKSLNSIYYPDNVYTGFKIGNDSNSLKFYDKKAQILYDNGKKLKKEVLRIEYRDVTGTKVKNYLGYNDVIQLTENLLSLDKTFKDRLYKDLISKIYKDIVIKVKDAVKKIKMYRTQGGKSAIDEYIKNDIFFDIEILLMALKETESPKNYSRQCTKAIESARDVTNVNLIGNIHLLNEILEKLNYPKIEMKMTPTIKKLLEEYY